VIRFPTGAIVISLLAFAAFGFGIGMQPTAITPSSRQGMQETIQANSFPRWRDRFRSERPSQDESAPPKYFSISIAGATRSYYLFDNSLGGNSQAPLLIMLHGGGGSAKSAISVTQLGKRAKSFGVDVIFPEGSSLGQPARWNTGLSTGSALDNVNDIGFLDKIVQVHATSSRPVFIAGLSNGGMMALRQICQGSSRFAGAFVVAASTSETILKTCNAKASQPIALVHGKLDSIVPYSGGVVKHGNRSKVSTLSSTPLVSHDRLISFWRGRNGCSTQESGLEKLTSLRNSPDISLTNLASPLRSCRQTLSFTITNGNHGWPTDPSTLSPYEQRQFKLRRRISVTRLGGKSGGPGDMDTTGIILDLIGKWSAKS
jgi:polyhydroxybutyrate depolymerase